MKDLQSEHDQRDVEIDEVGVSGLRYPIMILDRARERQRTIAAISMSVRLPPHVKGTHMSRFIEVLEGHAGEVTVRTLPTLLDALKQRLESNEARLEARFPYFVARAAPVSGAVALMDFDCWLSGRTGTVNGDEFVMGARIPVTSLCPCSKAISDYGAHNQRGYVTIELRTTSPDSIVWFEELAEIAERSASAPVYPLLKRSDERHVTMQAYDNPAFVEDMIRSVAVQLRADERVGWFRAHVENVESIHNHSAYARLEWRRTG